MYRVKLVATTSSFYAKELRITTNWVTQFTDIINLFSKLSLNEATFHLCLFSCSNL